MSTHFDELLDQLQRRCCNMATAVQHAVGNAADSVKTLNVGLAQRVHEGERHIDAEEVEIERMAINLLVLHHPAATDFRTVFGIVKINGDLERIADCAVNIAQQVGRLVQCGVETVGVPREVRAIAEAALAQVGDTVRCIATRDPELADKIRRADDLVDTLNSQILQELQAGMQKDASAVPADLAMIMVAKNFERIGDHCVNIAEDVVFLMRGKIVRHQHEQKAAASE